jgi:deoxyribodipyrimidine photo-lyase
MSEQIAIHWFRRDLRLYDNHALSLALRSKAPVKPIFIFDTCILDELAEKADRRVQFIHNELLEMKKTLRAHGSDLAIYHGDPLRVWMDILEQQRVEAVYTNEDYEPYATQRDHKVRHLLSEKGVKFISVKDHILYPKDEVLKDDGKPYTVYTPYMKKWKKRFEMTDLEPFDCELNETSLLEFDSSDFESLDSIGFKESEVEYPSRELKKNTLKNYADKRDYPSVKGTSRLSVHLRFGTVSIRQLYAEAWETSEKWVNELIWRSFYSTILYHFPHVEKNAFRPIYDRIPWRNNEEEFEAWKTGKTGYPLVDAGMRELNETGFMHNRVRMLVASFLTKHLLIDWRWGEAYFAQKLLDFDLASNNGGWQWAAGSGVDAAPYFRIFNPESQQKKFDPKGIYIRKWIPEFDTLNYPRPIVEHKFARQRCLDTYKNALQT